MIFKEGMWLLGTLTAGFFLAIVLLATPVIQWSVYDMLWFLPLCIIIAYGGRIAVWAIKTRTDNTELSEAIKAYFPSLKGVIALVEGFRSTGMPALRAAGKYFQASFTRGKQP
jgi:hypothetical protein